MYFETDFLLLNESIYHIRRHIFFVTGPETLFTETDSDVETPFAYIYYAGKSSGTQTVINQFCFSFTLKEQQVRDQYNHFQIHVQFLR